MFMCPLGVELDVTGGGSDEACGISRMDLGG